MAQLDGAWLDANWDFEDAAVSEQRFRDAISSMDGAAADELRTQIARALGLQGKFAEALNTMSAISSDDPVVKQRVALERGRVHNSAGDVAQAIPYFLEAQSLAADPYLTVDAMHMLAFTDIAKSEEWYRLAMEISQASTDPRVRRWQGSLLNNHAWSLADSGDLAGALGVFREAESWFREHGTLRQIHIARWSVAHVLRRLGEIDAAREILLDLKAQGEPDTYVDEELGLL